MATPTLNFVSSINGKHLLYNSSTGALYYDADGSAGGAVQVAVLGISTHPNVLSTDFLIIV